MNLRVDMFWKKGSQTINDNKTKEISGRVLASFGLSCLKKAMKGGKGGLGEGMSKEELEQLVGSLGNLGAGGDDEDDEVPELVGNFESVQA